MPKQATIAIVIAKSSALPPTRTPAITAISITAIGEKMHPPTSPTHYSRPALCRKFRSDHLAYECDTTDDPHLVDRLSSSGTILLSDMMMTRSPLTFKRLMPPMSPTVYAQIASALELPAVTGRLSPCRRY